jgi:hypothetical protein
MSEARTYRSNLRSFLATNGLGQEGSEYQPRIAARYTFSKHRFNLEVSNLYMVNLKTGEEIPFPTQQDLVNQALEFWGSPSEVDDLPEIMLVEVDKEYHTHCSVFLASQTILMMLSQD